MNPVHSSLNGCRSTSNTFVPAILPRYLVAQTTRLPLATNETQIRENVELASVSDKFRGATIYRK
jgi:hypothetical protein